MTGTDSAIRSAARVGLGIAADQLVSARHGQAAASSAEDYVRAADREMYWVNRRTLLELDAAEAIGAGEGPLTLRLSRARRILAGK